MLGSACCSSVNGMASSRLLACRRRRGCTFIVCPVDEHRVVRGLGVVVTGQRDVVRREELVDGARCGVEARRLAVDREDAVVAGAEHDVGPRVEAPRDVADGDQLADVQRAHEPCALRSVVCTVRDGTVEVDGDRERRSRAGPAHRHCVSAWTADDDGCSHEQRRAAATARSGTNRAAAATCAGLRRAAEPARRARGS